MSPERKAMMLEKLKAGKAMKAKARADAKEKGLPDPHPRKKRMTKADKLAMNPSANPSANDTVRGIDQATKEGVADKPVDVLPVVSKPIDVPGLQGDSLEKMKKKVVKNPEAVPVVIKDGGLSKTGKTKKIDVTDMILNEETGNQVIPAQYADQIKSIKNVLKTNKKLITTVDPKPENPNAITDSKTNKNLKKHVPDLKAIEGRQPFSFSAARKLLWQ
jgi:hypothetical protein